METEVSYSSVIDGAGMVSLHGTLSLSISILVFTPWTEAEQFLVESDKGSMLVQSQDDSIPSAPVSQGMWVYVYIYCRFMIMCSQIP